MKSIQKYAIGICLILSFCYNSNAQEYATFPSGSIILRTNLPSFIVGVPSLGLAYKITDRLELGTDVAYSHWKFKRKGNTHHWNNLNISPQIRNYLNTEKDFYLGLQYSIGEYNMSSNQGQYMGGGILIGKQYHAGKKLIVDIGLTLGYLHLRNRIKYTEENGIFFKEITQRDADYWGPTAFNIRISRRMN